MEIVNVFDTNGLQKHITITGTTSNPLFRASDIRNLPERRPNGDS